MEECDAMAAPAIRVVDGPAYERRMGGWSRITGDTFLPWRKPLPGLRWIDVGRITQAFTELETRRCGQSIKE